MTGKGNADVVYVKAVENPNGTWTFHITVSHPDTGWSDYANGWDIVTEAGEVLKVSSGDSFTRTLLHPHMNEQPFTRSQSDIVIPSSTTRLRIRAHDLVDGYGGKEVWVDMGCDKGKDFEIHRK